MQTGPKRIEIHLPSDYAGETLTLDPPIRHGETFEIIPHRGGDERECFVCSPAVLVSSTQGLRSNGH